MIYLNYYSGFSFDTRFDIKNGIIKVDKISTNFNCHFGAIGGKIIIGKGTTFNRNCIVACYNEIIIGNNVYIGPNVSIYDHNHKFDKQMIYYDKFTTGTIIIENNCWIGAGCIILKNTHIGEGSVIAAGCVVKGNIPPHSLVKSSNKLLIEPLK